jgi:hypothetical protein
MVDDILPSSHLPEVQGPAVEIKEGSLQADIQVRITHPHPDGLMVRIEEDSVDLQTFAALAVGLHVEEVEIEAGHPQQDEEGDPEPGKIQGFPDAGKREEPQGHEEGKKPEREPGPTRLETGQVDKAQDAESRSRPEGQSALEPPGAEHLSKTTHALASPVHTERPPLPEGLGAQPEKGGSFPPTEDFSKGFLR